MEYIMLLPKGFALMLASLIPHNEQTIQDTTLKDRVLSCGTEFSDELQSNLSASFLIHSIQGSVNKGFKLQAKELIFSELPYEAALQAYEGYLECIEEEPDFVFPALGIP